MERQTDEWTIRGYFLSRFITRRERKGGGWEKERERGGGDRQTDTERGGSKREGEERGGREKREDTSEEEEEGGGGGGSEGKRDRQTEAKTNTQNLQGQLQIPIREYI